MQRHTNVPTSRKLVPTFAEEVRLLGQGYRCIAGVDEVGRGPLAGPVVAGAVVLDLQADLPFYPLLRDSKALTPAQRERLSEGIRRYALGAAVGAAGPEEIDQRGIVGATLLAMARAVASLPARPDHLLIDAVPLPEAGIPFRAIIKGDALCRSIAAASIIAKVERDQLMERLDGEYPGYGFARHKGYPTAEHLRRLAAQGPCPIHRRVFAPVRGALGLGLSLDRAPQAAPKPGALAEEAVAGFLQGQGYQVLARNYRCPWGEVDLVVQDRRGVLAFVEVKARRSNRMGSPVEAVTRQKGQRIALAAQHYLQRHGLEAREWRIDLAAVRLGRGGEVAGIQHITNAVEE
ncbi:MAG: ribonuclease HII [Chloroflexi bacterium]|nr:ribonuclease HII [Chloroflexota bacterium]